MGGIGRIVINFGAAPGSTTATVNVTGQSAIVSGSYPEAYVDATGSGTPDHNAQEHSVLASTLGITCENIVPGTGFTIWAVSNAGNVVGQVNLIWIWITYP